MFLQVPWLKWRIRQSAGLAGVLVQQVTLKVHTLWRYMTFLSLSSFNQTRGFLMKELGLSHWKRVLNACRLANSSGCRSRHWWTVPGVKGTMDVMAGRISEPINGWWNTAVSQQRRTMVRTRQQWVTIQFSRYCAGWKSDCGTGATNVSSPKQNYRSLTGPGANVLSRDISFKGHLYFVFCLIISKDIRSKSAFLFFIEISLC